MNTNRIIKTFSTTWLLLALVGAYAPQSARAESTTLLKTEFNSATLGSYANNTTINASQPTTERMTVYVTGPTNVVAAVDLGGGNNAIDFTDNATSGNCYARRTFTPLSTNLDGVNYVEGSFEITPLGAPDSNHNPEIQFVFAQSFDSGGNYSAVQMQFRGLGTFSYRSGSISVSGPALTPGVTYRVNFYVDLSDGIQDTWGFSLTRLSDNTVMTNPRGLNTRGANLSPDRIVFNAGANPGAFSASPFVRIDNIDIAAFPKPIPPDPTVIVIR